MPHRSEMSLTPILFMGLSSSSCKKAVSIACSVKFAMPASALSAS